ncbi:MFS transporter [Anaerolineales bacterium HSG24]|nr:MFS transporter [Anaerolineales bacterium HSG24]
MTNQHPYLVLALVSFGVFIAADDLTVISTMLPQMIFDFEIPLPAGLDDASWIISAYLITHVVAMPLMGRISDLYGRRAVFIGCMALFAVGSLIVAQSITLGTMIFSLIENYIDKSTTVHEVTLNFLIFSRVIQAIGGGGVVPVAMAVVGDVFTEERRAFALGILGAVDTLGWIIGPLYGAFWVNYFTWQWQFYINIPISLLTILAGWMLLKPTDQSEHAESGGLDWLGAILLSLALTLLNIGLAKSGGQAATGVSFDFSTPIPTWQQVLPYIMGGSLALLIFVIVERQVSNPIIEIRMFAIPNFTLACLINFVVGFVLMIAMVGVPLFVNGVLAVGTTMEDFIKTAAMSSGQILSALTGAMSVLSIVGGWLCARTGYRLPTIAGLFLMGVGFYLMNGWSTEATYMVMGFHLMIAGMGFGLVIAPVGTAVINAVRAELRGVASGLVVIFRLMGMSVGLSSLTAWGLHRFDVLSQAYELTELGRHISGITAQIMNEIFLGSALLSFVAIIFAVWLRTTEKIKL